MKCLFCAAQDCLVAFANTTAIRAGFPAITSHLHLSAMTSYGSGLRYRYRSWLPLTTTSTCTTPSTKLGVTTALVARALPNSGFRTVTPSTVSTTRQKSGVGVSSSKLTGTGNLQPEVALSWQVAAISSR